MIIVDQVFTNVKGSNAGYYSALNAKIWMRVMIAIVLVKNNIHMSFSSSGVRCHARSKYFVQMSWFRRTPSNSVFMVGLVYGKREMKRYASR